VFRRSMLTIEWNVKSSVLLYGTGSLVWFQHGNVTVNCDYWTVDCLIGSIVPELTIDSWTFFTSLVFQLIAIYYMVIQIPFYTARYYVYKKKERTSKNFIRFILTFTYRSELVECLIILSAKCDSLSKVMSKVRGSLHNKMAFTSN
jgi:hypothetical protein